MTTLRKELNNKRKELMAQGLRGQDLAKAINEYKEDKGLNKNPLQSGFYNLPMFRYYMFGHIVKWCDAQKIREWKFSYGGYTIQIKRESK